MVIEDEYIGKVFAGCRIRRKIGEGGMAEVFLAERGGDELVPQPGRRTGCSGLFRSIRGTIPSGLHHMEDGESGQVQELLL